MEWTLRLDKWKVPPEVLKVAKKGKHTVMSDRARLYRTVSRPWACKPTLAKTWEEVEQGGCFKGNLFGLRCLVCQREVPQFTSLLKTTYCPAKKDQWPEVSTGLIHLGKAKGGKSLGSKHTDERIANRDLLKTLWGSTLRDVQESAKQRSKRRYHERGMTRGVMDDFVAGCK